MTEPSALILHASSRMEENLLRRAIKAGRQWQAIVTGMPDHELIGLAAAMDKEMERRGLSDRKRYVRG